MNAQQRVGKKLKKVRKEKGLRQVDMAKKIDCSSNWYAQIEQGKVTNPGSLLMNKIANVLGLDPSEVVFV
ncbi:MAG: helix-turn-helix domain-containing protein [Candidatus Levyibacteriota bacterium]|nr:MAG: helix-turn-helix domain-containing protein [Candidatus Levybacteria bacterium]